jgi:hypothetical protein
MMKKVLAHNTTLAALWRDLTVSGRQIPGVAGALRAQHPYGFSASCCPFLLLELPQALDEAPVALDPS